jgi:uncharacterized damage-inducible protein DinB
MRSIVLLTMVIFASCGFALTQQPASSRKSLSTISEIEDNSVKDLEQNIVRAADALPESKFSFAPTEGEFKGVRTFAFQVKHVAASNYAMASAVLKEDPPLKLETETGPVSITSKADIMKFLEDSFAYLHKAARSIDEKTATEQVPNPEGAGTRPRLDIMTRQLWHCMDHYGQMVLYLRMNGIVPPASRQHRAPSAPTP